MLPDLRLLIRPKVGLANVFFLLSYGAGLTKWREEPFPYGEDEFFDAIAWLVEAEVRRAARYRTGPGLPRTRGGAGDGARAHRPGSADPPPPGQPIPLDCRYQEYGEDMELNRVVKAALHRLLRVPSLDRQLALRAAPPPSALRCRRRCRLPAERGAGPDASTASTRPGGRPRALAQLILRADSVRDATGSVAGDLLHRRHEQAVRAVRGDASLARRRARTAGSLSHRAGATSRTRSRCSRT